MKVLYTPVAGAESPGMPLLTVRLRGPDGVFPLPMLVDSGANETLLPEAILKLLGVEVSGEAVSLMSFTGFAVTGHVGQVEMEVDGVRFPSRFVAVPDASSTIPILGHRDFFLNFWCGFDSSNRAFYVSPARRR